MAILDPETIPSEIKDQIEAASNDLGKAWVYVADGDEPSNDDPRVILLAQAYQRALTALAMCVL